jgi:hypothetical protein
MLRKRYTFCARDFFMLFALAQQVRHQQPAGATALPYSAFVTKLSASSRASSAAVRRPAVQAAFEVRAQVSAR